MKLKEKIKSFIEGVASINLFPYSIRLESINPTYLYKYAEEQDARALADDWKQVSCDLSSTISKFKEKYLR